jgi:hypothetical protein
VNVPQTRRCAKFEAVTESSPGASGGEHDPFFDAVDRPFHLPEMRRAGDLVLIEPGSER